MRRVCKAGSIKREKKLRHIYNKIGFRYIGKEKHEEIDNQLVSLLS